MSAPPGGLPADYFELFGMPARYAIDLGELERRYKALMLEVHPDRFAADTDRAKRLAVQYSGFANEAYRTLADPLRRGAYMVGKHGFDPFDEINTAMDPAFLMRQLELREALEDAGRDPDAIAKLTAEVEAALEEYREGLTRLLDHGAAWEEASGKIREMSYFVKAREQIERIAAAAGS